MLEVGEFMKMTIEELKLIAERLKKMSYSEFVQIVKNLTEEEILVVSETIGYPVFIRLCMGGTCPCYSYITRWSSCHYFR